MVYINKSLKRFIVKNPTKGIYLYLDQFRFWFKYKRNIMDNKFSTFDESFKIFIPFALILIPLFLSLFVGLITLLVGPYLKLDTPSLLLFSAV